MSASNYDDLPDNASASPALSALWWKSRWGPDDQKGNGNLMTPAKVLETIKPGDISIMPAGLDRQLTPQELADLVAFLLERK